VRANSHDALRGDHRVVDAEEPDADPHRAVTEEQQVVEVAADVEPALEEARLRSLPDGDQRPDDDGDPQRRDHHDVDRSAPERRVGDPLDRHPDQEHEHEREEVAHTQ
jgi:hypothetical protein